MLCVRSYLLVKKTTPKKFVKLYISDVVTMYIIYCFKSIQNIQQITEANVFAKYTGLEKNLLKLRA